VIGWLYTQGQILGASEVTSFHVEPIEGRVDAFDAHVELNGPILLVQKEPFYFPLPRKDRLDSEWHSLLSPLEVVGEIMNQLDERTSLFRETGGTHSMILFDLESRKVTDVCEDTSRHTCLDKLIGRALLEHRDLSREGLAMSCRVTTTIMRKIIRADIPFVLTRSATTAPAVQQACEAGITLICFARGRRYNLMT
jgi:formate dehydrogenase accessory protein FdhD